MDMSGEVERYRAQLAERIAETASKYPTKIAASEAAGISTQQLNNWISGVVKVPAEGLLRLALGVNVDFSWLVAGPRDDTAIRGHSLQEPVLREVLKALATVMEEDGVTFAATRFADLVFVLHDHMVSQQRAHKDTPVDVAEIARNLRITSSHRS